MMKAQCPKCKAVFQFDISKIPDIPATGIAIKCPKCENPLRIKIKSKTEKTDLQDHIIPCPDCGHMNVSAPKCAGCGREFTDQEKNELAIPIGKED
jgi:predicted Zn finger-like uncharacterized protein